MSIRTSVHAVARIEARVREFRETQWREINFIDAQGNTLYEVLAHPAGTDPVPEIEEVSK